MTAQYLSEALNYLSDDLLLETDRVRTVSVKKRPALRHWAGLAACLCLLAVGAVVLLSRPLPVAPEPNTDNPILSPGEVVSNTPGTAAPDVKVKLHINKLNGTGVADMDLMVERYDKLPYDVWQGVLTAFEEYTGSSYQEFTARFPQSWQITHFYSYRIRGYKDGVRSEEYDTLHDYIFDLDNGDGGSATVSVCSYEMPLRDCFFVSENPKESVINDTTLVIHGGDGLYLAYFNHDGLYYDVELSGISKAQLEEFLVALIVTE